jgi:hypothetical protein
VRLTAFRVLPVSFVLILALLLPLKNAQQGSIVQPVKKKRQSVALSVISVQKDYQSHYYAPLGLSMTWNSNTSALFAPKDSTVQTKEQHHQ